MTSLTKTRNEEIVRQLLHAANRQHGPLSTQRTRKFAVVAAAYKCGLILALLSDVRYFLLVLCACYHNDIWHNGASLIRMSWESVKQKNLYFL